MANRSDASADHDPFKNRESGTGLVNTRISDRENEYQSRRFNRDLRDVGVSYQDAMLHATLDREKHELIQEARKELLDEDGNLKEEIPANPEKRRKRRWDDSSGPTATTTIPTNEPSIVSDSESIVAKNRWDEEDKTANSSSSRRRKRWDETPVSLSSSDATPLARAPDATPIAGKTVSKWDETPVAGSMVSATPVSIGERKKSRWDQTPVVATTQTVSTPLAGATGTLAKALALEKEMESRNRPWTEAALDAILPSEGYIIIRPPTSYIPLRTPGRKLLATPTPLGMTPTGFQMEVPIEQRPDATVQEIREAYGVPLAASSAETGDMGALPYIKPEDMQYFGRLMEQTEEDKLTKEEANERKIMALLLKIKWNSTAT